MPIPRKTISWDERIMIMAAINSVPGAAGSASLLNLKDFPPDHIRSSLTRFSNTLNPTMKQEAIELAERIGVAHADLNRTVPEPVREPLQHRKFVQVKNERLERALYRKAFQ